MRRPQAGHETASTPPRGGNPGPGMTGRGSHRDLGHILQPDISVASELGERIDHEV